MSQFQFLETEVSLYSVLNVDGTEATLNNCIVIFHVTVWLFRAKGQTPSGFPRSPHQKHSHNRSYQRSDIGFPLSFGRKFKFKCLDIYSKIDSGTLQNICCNVVVALRSELTSPFTARSFEIPTLENHHEFIDHDCFCRQN